MSLWFESAKQQWRIRIRRKGHDIARILPKGTTEDQANEMHDALMRQVIGSEISKATSLADAREDAIGDECAHRTSWELEVERARRSTSSWFARMLYGSGTRSRKRNTEHNLTADDLERICIRSCGRCEVTGLRFSMEMARGVGQKLPFRPSLDRIDSSKGYDPDNCRLVCWAVNAAMGQWGEEVLRKIAVGMCLKDFGMYNAG